VDENPDAGEGVCSSSFFSEVRLAFSLHRPARMSKAFSAKSSKAKEPLKHAKRFAQHEKRRRPQPAKPFAPSKRSRPAKKPKQLELLEAPPRHFGGRLLLGKRKTLRPLATRESIHLVLRSLFATGELSFRHPRHRSAIERILISTAKKFGVQIYRKSINSNHIHLVLRTPSRRLYSAFVRVATGLIASQVMRGLSFKEFRRTLLASASSAKASDKQKPEPQGKGQKFFQFRPFTRVLHWGRDFRTCCQYVVQNTLEAMGFIIYKPRKDAYAKWVRESLADTELISA
jgi:REP element-mobilizing transposase RayT